MTASRSRERLVREDAETDVKRRRAQEEGGRACLEEDAETISNAEDAESVPGKPRRSPRALALTRADCGARATRAASGAAPCYAATSTVA